MIRVQTKDFDVGRELEKLAHGNLSVGGVCSFVGLVRDMAGDKAIEAMTLEHYPDMTEKALAGVEAEARERWPLEETLIIHRYGRLEPGDRIVGHSGGFSGISSNLDMFLDSGYTAIVMSNYDGASQAVSSKMRTLIGAMN